VEKGDDNRRAGLMSLLDKFCVFGLTFLAMSTVPEAPYQKRRWRPMCMLLYSTSIHAPPLLCLESQLAEVPSCYTNVLQLRRHAWYKARRVLVLETSKGMPQYKRDHI